MSAPSEGKESSIQEWLLGWTGFFEKPLDVTTATHIVGDKSRWERKNSLPTSADIVCAAWMVEDSLAGMPADTYPRNADVEKLCERRNRLTIAQTFYDLACSILIVLMLFEPPLWCSTTKAVYSFLPSETRCPLPDGSVAYFFFELPFLPPAYALLLEAGVMIVVTVYLVQNIMLWHACVKGGLEGFHDPRPEIFLGITLLMWLDWSLFVLFPLTFRMAPYCRIGLLFYWKRTRTVFWSAILCINEFCNIALFMIGTIVFFAWLLTMLLDDIKTKAGIPAEEYAGAAFGTFQESILSFFTIMTGASFPDLMITLVERMRWSILIFVGFMVSTYFLFTKLMLAVVYNAYQENLKDELKGFYGCQTRGLALAFSKLSGDRKRGRVDVVSFKELLKTLSGFPKMSKAMQWSSMEKVLQVIDDGSGELSFAQFTEACDILLYSFRTTPIESLIVRQYGWTPICIWIRMQIDAGRLEYFMNWLLMLNVVFIVVESTYDIMNYPEPYIIAPLEMFFSCIYVVEVAMKLTVTSFRNYWSNIGNRFEFVVSWLLFCTGVATIIPTGAGFRRFLPYLNILRMLRLLKLLERIQRFRMMFRCIFNLLLVSKEMVLLVMITMLFFAVLGVQIFGGLMYPTNPILQDTDFVKNNYNVLGFNDVASALVAMFCMMVCNYMPTYAIAMDRVVAFDGMGLLFCIVFFVFGVNIVFNVFTAFTIDVFLTLKEAQEQMKDSPGSTLVEDETILVEMQRLVTLDNQILHVTKPTVVLQKKTLLKVFHELRDHVSDLRAEVGRRISHAEEVCATFEESLLGNLHS